MLLLLKQSEKEGVINAMFEAQDYDALKKVVAEQIPNPNLVKYLETYDAPITPITTFTLLDKSRFTLLKVR